MKKQRFLFTLLMAIVMMAMSPQKVWALGGRGTSSDPYTIANASDLVAFASKVNGSEQGAYAKLTADITLTSAWTAMGTSSKPYTGTFDGQGHTISGFSMEGYTKVNAGFFGYVKDATIKNFTLNGTMTSSTQITSGENDCSGAVVGRAMGSSTIQDIVSNVNITLTKAQKHLGGVVGAIEGSTIVKGCTYAGTLNAGPTTDCIGGIVGFAPASCSGSITNCFFNGTLSSSASGPTMGGILGYTNDESNNFGGVQNCYSCGTLSFGTSDYKYVNAIVGRIRARATTITNNTYLSDTATRACNTDGPSIPASNKAITITLNAGTGGKVTQTYVNPTSTSATQLKLEAAATTTGYYFTKWDDNVTTASRTEALTGNITRTANFDNKYTITVATNNSTMGTVSGGGSYAYGDKATITATPKSGYYFVKWSDGNTNASRTVTVNKDQTLTAIFGEPKAVLSGNTLTFYCDADTHVGTTYKVTGSPGWAGGEALTTVVFDASFAAVRPATCYDWFSNCTSLSNITGLQYLNTSKVTDMRYMFNGCSKLTSLNLSSFNTANVEDMSSMFRGCAGLTSLDLSSFNTAKVTDMYLMFYDCAGLTSLTVNNFDMQNVTDKSDMFLGCTKLTTLNLKSLPYLADRTFNTKFSGTGKNVNLTLSASSVIYKGTNYLPTITSCNHYKQTTPVHVAATCTEEGYDAKVCSYCNSHFDKTIITATGHDFTVQSTDAAYQKSAATCTTDAVYYHKCSRCTTKGTNTWTKTGTATGHAHTKGYTPIYTWSDDIAVHTCSFTLKCLDCNANVVNTTLTGTQTAHTDATCTTNGSTTYKVTGSYNVSGSQSYSGTDTKAYTIPALGHDMTAHAHVPATCKEAGMDAYWTCSRCTGKLFKDENGTAEWDGMPVLAALGHDIQNNQCSRCDLKAKAVFANNTLTFYFDDIEHDGTTYLLNPGASPFPGWYDERRRITSVVFDASFANARPTSCYNWFFNCENLTTITGLEYLNTSEVTNMFNMYSWCSSLTSLDLSSFNTEKVTDMGGMFSTCSSLQSLTIGNFDMQQVAEMANMFSDCTALNTLTMKSIPFLADQTFNTQFSGDGKTVNLVLDENSQIYEGTNYLPTITNCNHYGHEHEVCPFCGYAPITAKAVYNNGTLTFYYDVLDHLSDGTVYALNTGTKLPGWNSIKSSITSIVFDESFADARPTTCYWWFFGCSKLTEITGIENLNTENVTYMTYMFYGCSGLLSLDLSKFNTEKVTSMERMFNNCSKLQSLDVGKFNTENVTNMSYMFSGCSGLLSLDLSKFNTEKVKNMSGMFYECSGLKSLDLSKFNTEMVTNMSSMFYNCSGLQSLDLSKFNTGMVTNMSNMFLGCSGLLSLDLSKFNTEKVKNMERMFNNCSKLQSLDLSNFNTENVTNMSTMFQSCSSLESLDLSSFNTTRVTDMTVMFQNCPSLRTLDFGNFDMQKVTSNYNLFFDNSALNTINFKSVPFVNQYFNTQSLSNGVTVNYELDDNSVIYTGTNYLPVATSAPTYTRNIAATSDWGTLVLPFEAKSDENVQLYTLSAASGENLTFAPVATVAANTPCVFKKKVADATSVVFTANTDAAPAAAAITATAAVDGLAMNGTYTALSNQTGMYFVAQNKFWLAEAPITIAPFRAWFEGNLGAGVKAFNILVEEADGIANISNANGMLNGKYMENGRVVIVKNGKKFNVNGQKIK